MSRTRRALPEATTAGRTPIMALGLEAFARRLHQAMIDQRLSPSDLAKKVWGTMTDSRGYEVARNRVPGPERGVTRRVRA